jgi:hypothetical protein
MVYYPHRVHCYNIEIYNNLCTGKGPMDHTPVAVHIFSRSGSCSLQSLQNENILEHRWNTTTLFEDEKEREALVKLLDAQRKVGPVAFVSNDTPSFQAPLWLFLRMVHWDSTLSDALCDAPTKYPETWAPIEKVHGLFHSASLLYLDEQLHGENSFSHMKNISHKVEKALKEGKEYDGWTAIKEALEDDQAKYSE